METAEMISSGAGALSTFGLYAIVAALVVVIVHLYRRVNHLEEKLREAVENSGEKLRQVIEKAAEDRTKELAKWQEYAAQTQEVIKANTRALERFLDNETGRRGHV